MCGLRFSVRAKRSWKMWELRDEIDRALRIPAYEQHLFVNNVKIRSTDVLSRFVSTTHDLPLKVTLMRSRVPEGISHSLASSLWQGFRALGRDFGETIEGARTASLLRFAGLRHRANLLRGRSDMPSSWTFPQCLAYVAELQQALVALPANEVEMDESSDGESDASSDDASPRSNGAGHIDDLDLRCEGRLMLNVRRNVHDEE
eukprot:TRINITY_DN8539_c0_g1_i1.p1 TRINITY_DN8539_c0_g1~~TRINITY_DN8539_c0_g1_i1.p1  ORF type:complete len:203 (+),score=27.83 TRINITY_DN8539_c0_g1_i1:3-611(+)